MNFKDKLRRRVPVREWYGLRDINNDGKLVPILVVWVGGVIVRAELTCSQTLQDGTIRHHPP